MSVFDRFRRNRQQSVLPEEVQQYYQSEKRQRKGVAVLVAIGALLATIAVAAILFFSFRFIYHQIHDKDSKSNEPTNGQDGWQNPDKTTEEEKKKSTDNQTQTTPTTPTPTPAPAANPAPVTTPTTTPALGDTSTLPHTGDEGL